MIILSLHICICTRISSVSRSIFRYSFVFSFVYIYTDILYLSISISVYLSFSLFLSIHPDSPALRFFFFFVFCCDSRRPKSNSCQEVPKIANTPRLRHDSSMIFFFLSLFLFLYSVHQRSGMWLPSTGKKASFCLLWLSDIKLSSYIVALSCS